MGKTHNLVRFAEPRYTSYAAGPRKRQTGYQSMGKGPRLQCNKTVQHYHVYWDCSDVDIFALAVIEFKFPLLQSSSIISYFRKSLGYLSG